MNTQGFYKKENNEIVYAPDLIQGSNYALYAAEKDTYTYPVDGWIWAENIDEAMVKLTVESYVEPPPFDVLPEGFKLKTSINDETEFNKLITLLKLGVEQGQINLFTPIKIKDNQGTSQFISVERFFEVMVQYGFYCYNNRNL